METKNSHVRGISLATDSDKRVATASIQVGDVLIRGIAVWRSPHGKLCVFFPSYRRGYSFEEAISLPSELRTEIEAEVIAAYKAADRAED